MTTTEVWHARAFQGEGAAGAPCAVALGLAPPDDEARDAARALGLALVAWTWPSGPGVQDVEGITPTGSATVSLQGALAAQAALEARGISARVASALARCAPRAEHARASVSLPARAFACDAPIAPLASVLGRDPDGAGPERVVRGPLRCYLRAVRDPATLALVPLDPARAWTHLRHEGLDALALYAPLGPGRLALRVFSAARLGREETASPEVVAALGAALARDGDPGGERLVLQGSGAPRRRAALWLDVDAERVAVGGDVRLLARGHLLERAALDERRAS